MKQNRLLPIVALSSMSLMAFAKSDKSVKAVEKVQWPVEKNLSAEKINELTLPSRGPALSAAPLPKSPNEYNTAGISLKLEPLSSVDLKKKTVAVPPTPELGKFEIPSLSNIEEKRKPVETFTLDEIRLFEAYVTLEDLKKPLAAYGSFASLIDSKSVPNAHAKWGLAQAAIKLGLRMQFETAMLDFLNTPKLNLQTRAYDSLVENSDPKKSVWLQSLSEEQVEKPLSTKTSDAFFMIRSSRYSLGGQITLAQNDLSAIKPESPLYPLRIYREAILLYRSGKPNLAYEALSQAFEKKAGLFDKDEETKTKAAMLWGRLAFQNREFNRAFEAYRTVPKVARGYDRTGDVTTAVQRL
jgi:tetratricopeptide (TPR) repeat protein